MNKKSSKDFIVIGFALFAMFFGAGNLIFPPFLGLLVGDKAILGIIGFLITGVGLPLTGVIACAKINATFPDMAARVGKVFSLIATTALILSIGPMLAIPRTAATTFELGVHQIFPSITPIISAIIFFAIVLVFVLRPSAIIDNIGKILTPGLLIMLAIIIIKGVVSPLGPVINTGFQGALPHSLLEGYQTMDVMASVIFASIVLASVRAKGYESNKEIMSVTVKAGLVSVAGLAFVYGGLMYLGSQTSTLFPKDIPRTKLVIEIVKMDLGNIGSLILGIAVALACITTAIGLLSTGAEFFSEKIFKGKVSYNVNAIVMAVVSGIIAVSGVDQIVVYAVPVLTVLYPIVIVLIAITLMGNFVNNNKIVQITVYTTLVISLIDTIGSMTGASFAKAIINAIPLGKAGFAWLLPAIIALIIGKFVFNKNENNTVEA